MTSILDDLGLKSADESLTIEGNNIEDEDTSAKNISDDFSKDLPIKLNKN